MAMVADFRHFHVVMREWDCSWEFLKEVGVMDGGGWKLDGIKRCLYDLICMDGRVL